MTGPEKARGAVSLSYLRELDTSLQERAVSSVVGADVAVLAPVAREGAVHTGQAAAQGKKGAVLGQSPQGHFLGCFSRTASLGDAPWVKRILYP